MLSKILDWIILRSIVNYMKGLYEEMHKKHLIKQVHDTEKDVDKLILENQKLQNELDVEARHKNKSNADIVRSIANNSE